MRVLRSIALGALCALPRIATAQGDPVASTVREFARDNGRNLVAAAQAMPAGKYGFKPTAAQWTFAELIIHIEGDNRITCSALSGKTPEAAAKLLPTDPKDKLVAALQQSITLCEAALAPLRDAAMGDTVSYYGQRLPRAAAAIGLVADWADHYGQQAIYLRLNGVLPPTARRSQ